MLSDKANFCLTAAVDFQQWSKENPYWVQTVNTQNPPKNKSLGRHSKRQIGGTFLPRW